MIKYSLRCGAGHAFDSWFASAAAYAALAEAGRLSCAVCGEADVRKALMAPRVAAGDVARPAPHDPAFHDPAPQDPAPDIRPRPLATPASPVEAALAEFRARIEAQTEDVGRRFAAEARAIHDGTAPARAICGQAKPAEARALVEDGVPILPLPFAGPRQVN